MSRPLLPAPIRLGQGDAWLFGMLHLPAAPTRAGVVLCNPFGQTAMRMHRLLRLVAERLAQRGVAALRFDYHGTGDSAGDDDAFSIARGALDLQCVDSRLREVLGSDPVVTWLGAELGATVAARASATAVSPPDALVLWRPVLDAGAWLQMLRAAHDRVLTHVRGLASDAPRSITEALGFAIGPQLREELLAPGLGEVVALARARRCTVIDDALPGAHAGVFDAFRDRAQVLEVLADPSRTNWYGNEASGEELAPAALLEMLVSQSIPPSGALPAERSARSAMPRATS